MRNRIRVSENVFHGKVQAVRETTDCSVTISDTLLSGFNTLCVILILNDEI